jgi:hypothetical protein
MSSVLLGLHLPGLKLAWAFIHTLTGILLLAGRHGKHGATDGMYRRARLLSISGI